MNSETKGQEKQMNKEMKDEHIPFAIEAWKTTITVQQHFNTIEMQIRNLAVTVLTAVVGAAGLTNRPLSGGVGIINSSADWLVLAGLVAWLAFYFMDRWWYHRLLHGAVKHAQSIEKLLASKIPSIALSSTIGAYSPVKIPMLGEVHTNAKIDIFYGAIAVILILIVVAVF